MLELSYLAGVTQWQSSCFVNSKSWVRIPPPAQVQTELIKALEWRSSQTHQSVKLAPQGFVGANPTSSTMNRNLARACRLLLLTLFVISPLIINACLFSNQSSFTNSASITPIPSNVYQYQLPPNQSAFASLITQNPSPQAPAAEVTAVKPLDSTKDYPLQKSGKTGSYTIVALGDSMIDVMQNNLPQLDQALKKLYPQAKFKLLNYGVGGTSIEYGLTRLTSDYVYLGKPLPSLISQNPDIVVVESFAYNHWGNDQTGLDRQWLTLAKIIETIKSQSQAKIVLAATIAPNETVLCDGIENIHLLPEQKQEKAQTIRSYLQNLVNFATSEGYPLADAYHASLDSSGNGRLIFINGGDHLHPSGKGGELLAKKIAEAIYRNNLL